MPIPPNGWGAVEFDMDYKLKSNTLCRNYKNKNLNSVIQYLNSKNFDVVHIMYDDYVIISPYLKCKKIYLTTHYAYITHPNFKEKYNSYFNRIFMSAIKCAYNKNKCYFKKIKDVYIKYGFPENRINIIHNGAREDKFLFLKEATKKRVYIWQK